MTHNDDNIPELPDPLRDAVRDYNAPPELSRADLESMWTAIEAQSFKSDIGGRVSDHDKSVVVLARRWLSPRTILPIAATLLFGFAIGRYSARARNASDANNVSPRMTQVGLRAVPEPYQATTSRYLGQTAALLVDLPDLRSGGGRADDRLVGRAHELLLTTRLLMDSPAADDARIRSLLEDLELVLAQVVRLQSGSQGRSELDLIRQAMDQRDVMPRLRTAVADISADN